MLQGVVLHQLGDDKLAEKILRDAINTDPTSHASWLVMVIIFDNGNGDDCDDKNDKVLRSVILVFKSERIIGRLAVLALAVAHTS